MFPLKFYFVYLKKKKEIKKEGDDNHSSALLPIIKAIYVKFTVKPYFSSPV